MYEWRNDNSERLMTCASFVSTSFTGLGQFPSPFPFDVHFESFLCALLSKRFFQSSL